MGWPPGRTHRRGGGITRSRHRRREWPWSDALLEKVMDWWSLAPYWMPALAAVIAVVVLVGAVRSRAARRSARPRQGASSSVDQFYLDSSHIGEPQARDAPHGYARFDVGPAAGAKRRGRR
jgi:hypothetical protein